MPRSATRASATTNTETSSARMWLLGLQPPLTFEMPRLSGNRVDETYTARQQLQRLAVIPRNRWVNGRLQVRIDAVIDNADAKGCHVRAQLVFLAGSR